MKKLLLLTAILFVGCFADTKTDIIGKWKNETTKMELFKDGTVSINKNGTPMTGTYSVLEDDRLKMTITAMGMTMTQVAKIKLKDNSLSLTAEDNNKTTNYTR